MYKAMWIFMCILGFLVHDSQELRGSPWRGRRKSKSGEISLGMIGMICRGGDRRIRLQGCYAAKLVLERAYSVSFNKVKCVKNTDTNFRTQCHLKMKGRKTTDFECYVHNTEDMSGAAVARCRAPWGKPLNRNQQMAQSMGGGMGMMPGQSPYGMSMPPGGPYGMGMSPSPYGMNMPMGGMSMGMG